MSDWLTNNSKLAGGYKVREQDFTPLEDWPRAEATVGLGTTMAWACAVLLLTSPPTLIPRETTCWTEMS